MKYSFCSFGLLIGAIVSVLVTLIILVWEWVENPGGIFRDQNGTNWSFVFDTASSWFVPTFLYTALIVALLYLVLYTMQWIKQVRHKQ
ncbi:hypothetical protein [uncultured Shewanella sp.]|uniref:hypothetical protein n=1 Tax=uncultured Shewanella sp. TaxID=173975 RepID=UPI0026026FAB|nr:hypothetical protein [uncultured Shewanella sp.]